MINDDKLRAEFEAWFNTHHPHDWWAKERNDEPLPANDRLRVHFFACDAYAEGVRAGLKKAEQNLSPYCAACGKRKEKCDGC